MSTQIDAPDLVRLAMRRLGTESYADLARALGLSSYAAPKNIRRWLDGETKPGYESTLKLLDLVGALNEGALERSLRDLRGSHATEAALRAEAERARGRLPRGDEAIDRDVPPRRETG